MNYVKTTLRALSSKNYRLFMIGQGISLIGTWVQQTALSWLIYRLTSSVALLGVVGFCGQIPSFFISPFAGVLVDRVNKHRLIILTQILSMLQAIALGTLLLTGLIKVWHILSLSVFIGFVNAFDVPARQSFVIEMVEDKSLLGNAIALNSSMFNIARIIGPTVAGIMIATVGEGLCFYVNAVSYAAVIVSLFLMQNIKSKINIGHKSVLKSLRDGFNYAFGSPQIRAIIIQLSLVSLTGVPVMVFLPVFAKDILHGGAHTLGFLMGASGIGALCGALFLASRRSVKGFGRLISFSALLFSGSLICFSLSRLLWLSTIMLFLTGFGMMVQMTASNTILQTVVDDDKRGRVMSIFTMAVIGIMPFGSLAAGIIASHIGTPETLMVGGICSIISTIAFFRRLSQFG